MTQRQLDMMQQGEAPVWITDPGHAWLRVPLADYTAAGITASRFSYIDAEYVYLEEDADAALYLDMVQAPEQSFREIHFNSEHTPGNPRKLDRIGGNVAREVTPAEILQAAQDTGRLVIISG